MNDEKEPLLKEKKEDLVFASIDDLFKNKDNDTMENHSEEKDVVIPEEKPEDDYENKPLFSDTSEEDELKFSGEEVESYQPKDNYVIEKEIEPEDIDHVSISEDKTEVVPKVEVEEPVREEKKEKKVKDHKLDKDKKTLILTIVLAVIVLYFFGKTIYGFYIGFKYKDYDSNITTQVEKKTNLSVEDKNKETISPESVFLQEIYAKYKNGLCENNHNLTSTLYQAKKVSLKDLSISEIGSLVFNNVKNIPNCGEGKVSVSLDEIKNIMNSLFANDSYINELTSKPNEIYGNFNVDYDSASQVFSVGYENCGLCADDGNYTLRKLDYAEKDENNLYIYERFGFFSNQGNNSYNVYSDVNKIHLMTTYTKTDAEFSDNKLLGLYKWTLREENDNYYFDSIEFINE